MALLNEVTSWIYHLGDVDAGKAAEIAASDAGLVVVDYSTYVDGAPRPYTSGELESMRADDDTLVVSYISVGEAEDYRDYWQDSWNSNPPDFLSASNPEWPDNYKVKYWDPDWQNIIFDNVRDIVDAGFNGLYLDIIDAYYFWNEVDPNSGLDYEAEMADFVAEIRAVAEDHLAAIGEADRNFVVIGQNGEELVLQPEYLAAVDGIAKEDLAFYYPNGSEGSFQPVPQGWYEGSTELLEAAQAAGVEVFVVEYMTQQRQEQYSDKLEDLHTYLVDQGMPLYIAEDRDLTDIYDQPFASVAPPVEPEPVEPEQVEPEPVEPEPVEPEPVEPEPVEPEPVEPEPVEPEPMEPEPVEPEPVEPEAVEPEPVQSEPVEPEPVEPEPVEPEQQDEGLILRGSGSSDDLFGGTGNDSIVGRSGSDMLSGDDGDDTLKGGRGLDDLYGGDGDDRLYGGVGHDFLSGDDGMDTLWGGRGHDELVGGEGDDVLTGGQGYDLFFMNAFSGHDTVTDFEVGKDRIVLEENPLEILQAAGGTRIILSEEASVFLSGTILEEEEDELFLF